MNGSETLSGTVDRCVADASSSIQYQESSCISYGELEFPSGPTIKYAQVIRFASLKNQPSFLILPDHCGQEQSW